ncbi:uncharacterized protein METZ01_LOCUS159141 [marine metagenome]|uniref:Nicotinamide nucleotide repair protein n=1 Tax=marine metagenome TaxID=408172 RepID=A0A382AZ99_9ZZZZ
MRSIDRRTIEEFHISGYSLMERAGFAVTQAAVQMMGDIAGKRVEILCGKGNNGGDGFVVGRLLTEQGADVRCLLLCERTTLEGATRKHMDQAEHGGARITEVADGSQIDFLPETDLIVDAILGTGLKGPIRSLAAHAITCINKHNSPVLSVDVPSGFIPEIGPPDEKDRASWPCVLADRTVTIGLMKVELATFPGKKWSGQLDVADIGFPPEAIEAEHLWLSMPSCEEIQAMLPGRKQDAHKGDCGRVVIVAGSVGMTGAASMTASAAMRSGAGMAILGAPESLVDVLSVKLTEVMVRPLPETSEHSLSLDAEQGVQSLLEWGDVLAIGPGLSQQPETRELVRRVVAQSPCPLVIDADGLNAYSGQGKMLAQRTSEAVITPHVVELSRLTGSKAEEILSDRIVAARHAAQQFELVVALKGTGTVVASPDGRVSINPTGNPGMATAGAGDVLTGITAGLMAQGMRAFEAAVLGVYLHGLSGDIAAVTLGTRSLMASDLITCLPQAIVQMESGCSNG